MKKKNAEFKKACTAINTKISSLTDLIVALKTCANSIDNESSEFQNAITLIKRYTIERERLISVINKISNND